MMTDKIKVIELRERMRMRMRVRIVHISTLKMESTYIADWDLRYTFLLIQIIHQTKRDSSKDNLMYLRISDSKRGNEGGT